MATLRTFTGGRFALDVDGFHVDELKKFSGLDPQADVVANDLGPAGTQKKHVANVHWTPGLATTGMGMGKGLYGWIKAALNTGAGTRGGVFKLADFNYKVKSTFQFLNASVTDFTVPRLDGASKEAGAFDVGFAAEQVRWAQGAGDDLRGQVGTRPKAWLCANFKVAIGTLPCTRVATVDSFTWRCAAPASGPGPLHPPVVTVPDLRLTISSADYDAWAEAAKKWFIDGEHLEGNETAGRITFLGPNLVDELGSIDLVNVGFRKFERPAAVAGSEQIERFAVELYVEKMLLNIKEYDA
jgi:hypothetical protein